MNYTINIAKHSGFCSGVAHAVNSTKQAIANFPDKRICTFGEIIHNKNVTEDFKNRGVLLVNNTDELKNLSEAVVILRSHGVPKNVYDIIENYHENNITLIDGTCRFVKNIHKIVEEKYNDGYLIIILGDKNHSEVVGINGYCSENAIICGNFEELSEFFEKKSKNIEKKVAIVAQTTYNINVWDKCLKIIEQYCPEAEVFNTICSATAARQTSATALAKTSDFMIIVGGRHSSNTVKLFQICKTHCVSCVHIEDASELSENTIIPLLRNNTNENFNVGITAGASTPANIIKEVKNKMSEILENQNLDEDFNFEEALNATFKKIYTGNRVKGYITAVNNSEAVVDIGTKHTGYIALSELTDDPSLKPSDIVKVGDEVDLIVIKINDAEGIATLSKKKVDSLLGFDKLVKAKENDAVLEGYVASIVKGGLIAICEGVRVFIPASQATNRRDEKLENFKGKTVSFKLIEVVEQKFKAVGSIKLVSNAKREAEKAKFWETVEVGNVYTGEIKSLTNYGAFVDLGGIDGMVHISELSWSRIKHPSEVVSVGDTIEVFIKELNKETNRISLGYKKDIDNPWTKFAENYNIDDVIDCKIVSITPFGAFASITDNVDGLIHISQVSAGKVNNVNEVLKVGDEVKAKLIDIDNEKKRISLSIRALLEEADEAAE